MTGRPGALMAVAAVSSSGASRHGPLRCRLEQRGRQLGVRERGGGRRGWALGARLRGGRKRTKEGRKKKGKRGRKMGIFAGFPGFGRQRDFRDGGDVEADWPGDHGVRGIPGTVADRGAGAARGGRRPECGRCRLDSRHAR
jgi:hypothetical protein